MRYLLLLLLILTACTPVMQETIAPLPTLAPLPEEVFPLFFWESDTSQLSTSGQVDWWQFGGEAGDNIFIRTVTRGVELRMTLLQDDRILLEGITSLEFTLPESRLYQLRVDYVSGAGQYDIGLGYTDRSNPAHIQATPIPQIVGVPTPTPPFSSLGEFINGLSVSREYAGLLNENSPQHIYTLQGTANQIINFELYRIAGELDPVLRFYDTDGNLIAMDDNSLSNGNARLLNLRLPSDGLYSVQVDGKGFYGDYTLVFINDIVSVIPDVQASSVPTSVSPYATEMIRFAVPDQRLQDHLPAINSITRVGDFQRFSFTAVAGERISMVVEPLDGSTIIPRFEVFDPNGEQIAFASASASPDSNVAATNGIIITQSGANIIIVTAEDNTAGQFVISFGRGASVRDDYQGFALSDSQTTGEISSIGTRHIWQLPLNPSDIISIAVSPNDASFDPVIELVTSDGEIIYRDDNGGVDNAALIQMATIVTPATYLLRVYDETGTNTGSYTLLWNYVSVAPTPTPIPALTRLLSVEALVLEGQYEFFAFQGQAGQQVRIEVVADDSSALDPVLAILNPAGDIILEADDTDSSLNPSAILTLPDDGTYRLRVNGYLSSGQFTATIAILYD